MKLKPREFPAAIVAGARRLIVRLRQHEFWFWSSLITVLALWATLAVGRSATLGAESIGREINRLEAVEAMLAGWEQGFQPAQPDEEFAWREGQQALNQLAGTRSDPLAVAQQVARRAEELGISGVPISLRPPDAVSGDEIEIGGWTIQSGATAIQVGFQADLGSVISFVGALPPTTTVQSLTLDRIPNGLSAQAVLLTQRPAGGN